MKRMLWKIFAYSVSFISRRTNPPYDRITTKDNEKFQKVVILNTWVNDTNLGNKIIMEAVYKELRSVFPNAFFYEVPALEYVRAGRKLVQEADYVFLAGTNLLSADMDKTSEWRISPKDAEWIRKKVILMGVGWWQYQDKHVNRYTRALLDRVLSKEYYHAVRDSYTAERLRSLGFKVVNTGCPSLWGLQDEHQKSIPPTKSSSALITFTEYNQNPESDSLLFEIVRKHYDTIYFWPQMYGDYQYAMNLCGDSLVVLPPSLEKLDQLLASTCIDYIGTRLHAGIRALQHGKRTIIIAVDNRAAEMGRDFGLPVVLRENLSTELEDRITGCWTPEIKLPLTEINYWKEQFHGSL